MFTTKCLWELDRYCKEVRGCALPSSSSFIYDSSKNFRRLPKCLQSPSHKLISCMKCVDIPAIAEFVLQNGGSDGQRRFCDIGYASDRNSSRSVESSGVSKPRMLEFTDNPILQSGAVGLSKLLMTFVLTSARDCLPGPGSTKEFSRWLPQNLLDVIRFALTNEEHAWDPRRHQNCTQLPWVWLTIRDGCFLTGGGGDYPFSDTAVSP
jgi:hypothetical protein